MSQYSNRDAFGWIAAVFFCLAFVACGAREEGRVELRSPCASAVERDFSTTSTLAKVSTTNVENALTSDSESCEFLRLSTRRPRLAPCSAREFQTLANRLIFERVDSRVYRFRPFWPSPYSPLPLYISFLTLRN